ncbi:ATP-grasp domain-containing protein [Candidatus Woesearchaeota archaeon]|nr:ATP-grasp domain-containing protein [Candidatus Woesearchaeota archaeon]
MNLPQHSVWLLISGSVRAMVQSGVRAGLACVAMDLYADEDTRQRARAWARIPAGILSFEPVETMRAAERLAPVGTGCALIGGSGLDTDPGLLELLARGRTLYGNTPETLRLIKTPTSFFALLDSLGLPYPAIRFQPPDSATGWLIKLSAGTGGVGVRLAGFPPPPLDHYYQQQLTGAACSTLFLANGRKACTIGFNRLWSTDRAPDMPYVFAGAINRTGLNTGQQAQINRYLDLLVEKTGLKGLNSLDFMAGENGEIYLLEINPRPSATLSLYDDDFAEGLLALHIKACLGVLPDRLPDRVRVRAFRIFCSHQSLEVPESVIWPEWCEDRPVAGTSFPPARPVCRLTAEGDTVDTVLALLEIRQQQLMTILAG